MDKRNSPISQLGSLTSGITDTLKSTGSIPPECSKTSEIGPLTRRQPSDESATRMLSGKDGAVERLINCRTVAERDRAALSLIEQLVGSRLTTILKSRNAGEATCEIDVIGYSVEAPVSAEVIPEVRGLIASVTRPASRRDVDARFAAMGKIFPSKLDDENSGETWMHVVWRYVSEFPADVIIEALDNVMGREKFLPMPRQIVDECRWLGRNRMAMKNIRFVMASPASRR